MEKALVLYWNKSFFTPKDLISFMISILGNLYMYFSEQKQYIESEKEMKAIINIYMSLDKKEPRVYTEYIGTSYLLLAISQYDGKKYNEAKQACEKAISIFNSLSKQSTKSWITYIDKAQELLYDIIDSLKRK